LRLAAPIAIPDPTTATDLRELVLRFLAENGGRASARDVAEALGVPLRTVQDALGQLVGDESCRRERSGRTHEYALEDTTFFAPTITRLGAWRDAAR
jgi:DNA-binding transcriptional ArsR family regulator